MIGDVWEFVRELPHVFSQRNLRKNVPIMAVLLTAMIGKCAAEIAPRHLPPQFPFNPAAENQPRRPFDPL